jgi:lipoprotein-releasing system ATP-binding protein
MPQQTSPKPLASSPAARDAILIASGVRKSFKMGDSEVVVLKHVDLVVPPGEFVAVEGRSGSGKSTLLHILAGLDAPNAGEVLFDDIDIAALAIAAERRRNFGLRMRGTAWLTRIIKLALVVTNRADRRLAAIRNTQFGFVFQFYHLLPELNVLENTMLGPMIQNSWASFASKRGEIEARAVAVLKQLGMDHRMRHKPNQLSGGERQRVAIARALMNTPKVLFADEPTGNLDLETGKQIMSVFEELHREHGQTVVMVTHDRSLARRADRVLILRDGKIERAAEVTHE